MKKLFKLNQPPGLYILFFTELWERFSYFGMRALLIFYMTEHFHYSDDKSYLIYGAYTSLIYVTPLIGGFLADRVYGFQQAIILGGVLMALGHFCMAIPHVSTFYMALALLIVGNGFIKPNVASLLGQLYEENDPRRDSGFTLFYVGINLGAFLAPLSCGFIGQKYGWDFGFLLAGIGMLLGLAVFIYGKRYFNGVGEKPKRYEQQHKVLTNHYLVTFFVLCLVPIFIGLIVLQLTTFVIVIAAIVMCVIIIHVMLNIAPHLRKNILAIIIMMICAMLYWAFADQSGSSLNLFTQRNLNRHVFGYSIPASVFQAVNPIFIIVFGPILAQIWLILANKKREPSTGFKFFLSLLFTCCGFLLFFSGAKVAYLNHGQSSFWWLVGGYYFLTLGELCLEPVGMSIVTKLAPIKMVGLMMGCWYLADSAFANYLASRIALFTAKPDTHYSPVSMAQTYSHTFGLIGVSALIVAFIILCLVPWLKRLMQ